MTTISADPVIDAKMNVAEASIFDGIEMNVTGPFSKVGQDLQTIAQGITYEGNSFT